MDFKQLENEGKTVIYKETESNEHIDGWELWGVAKTPEKELFVWRKIVTFEEAEQFYSEQEYN